MHAQRRLVGTLVASNWFHYFFDGGTFLPLAIRIGWQLCCVVAQVLLISAVGLMMDQGTWFRQMKIYLNYSQDDKIKFLFFSSRSEFFFHSMCRMDNARTNYDVISSRFSLTPIFRTRNE